MEKLHTFDEFVNEAKKQTYDYGCAMVFLDAPGFSALQERIDPADLHQNGLESEPHVTLLYGLHSNEINDEEVMKVCETDYPPISLHNVSLFENDDFDVLKFDATSGVLTEVNRKLTKLPHTTNFPDYHAHATIAYLKPGTGRKYVSEFGGETIESTPAKIVYSKPDGSRVEKKIEKD